MIDNDEGLHKRFDEITSLIAAQEKKLLDTMEDHRQKLENVMNTHHEEAKEMAMGHKHQLDDLKISTTKMPVAPADNK